MHYGGYAGEPAGGRLPSVDIFGESGPHDEDAKKEGGGGDGPDHQQERANSGLQTGDRKTRHRWSR